LGLGNTIVFKGFESLYKQVVDIEDQLLYSEVREEAKETFDDLRKLFESFQSKVRVVTLKAKRKNLQNLRQMTIHVELNKFEPYFFGKIMCTLPICVLKRMHT
jgi:hypothetical protein